jgi:capsular polysaccharide export protein
VSKAAPSDGPSAQPLLRIPPFPGVSERIVSRTRQDSRVITDDGFDLESIAAAIRDARIGGSFWGRQPVLPIPRPIIARPASQDQADAMHAHALAAGVADRLIFWQDSAAFSLADASLPPITGECDPWHLFSLCEAFWTDTADETAILAGIAGIETLLFGHGEEPLCKADGIWLEGKAQTALHDAVDYWDPFDDRPSDLSSTIGLLGHWRALIDSNRLITAAFGFAHWKKASVAPLLWAGGAPTGFRQATTDALQAIPSDRSLAIWKARVPARFLRDVEARNGPVHEVEDGFIRSVGLGADCVPPLSIVVDPVGVHYDPTRPSGLEMLLQDGAFTPEMLDRAERLRRLIVEGGISKYGVGSDRLVRPAGIRRHILVTGQVEDDRSVLFGGGEVKGNLDLLERTRRQEPDAFLIYKPHPDVEAGHRKGAVPDEQALRFADAIEREQPISSLLDMVDGIHVITSLAGFEAMIRGKQVTTHGIPFYAGWGLTADLAEIPARRTARRTVIEMVAAVLMLYPRYLDPVTGLPCPPEILVRRIVEGVRRENGAIVSLRRLQGKLRQKLSKTRIGI